MPAKVFISCGQGKEREKDIANKIAKLLKERFDFDYYLAFEVQGLNDIMKITDELRSSDYYLFIDFYRKDDEIPFSLFTHQELALAHHLGFKEIIAFQEKGTPLEGFLRYVQANPEPFENEIDLLKKVEAKVTEHKWTKDYSRNLVITGISDPIGPIQYGDHTGTYLEYIWHGRIENHRSDAAVNAVCILDYITFNGKEIDCNDRNYLKWANQTEITYQRTILPKDYGIIDVFAIHAERPGIYLHSAKDSIPRQPILIDDGEYKLHYKVFSEGFPLLTFVVQIDYHYSPAPTIWKNLTRAKLID